MSEPVLGQVSLRADIFDCLPQLHELLSRIDHHATSDESQTLTKVTAGDETTYADQTPLEPRDLSKEVLLIKTKIRRTIRELEKLPEMDKTVQDQEQEIEELEARVRLQQNMLSKLKIVMKGSTE